MKVSTNVKIAMQCFENFGGGQMPPPLVACLGCVHFQQVLLADHHALPFPNMVPQQSIAAYKILPNPCTACCWSAQEIFNYWTLTYCKPTGTICFGVRCTHKLYRLHILHPKASNGTPEYTVLQMQWTFEHAFCVACIVHNSSNECVKYTQQKGVKSKTSNIIRNQTMEKLKRLRAKPWWFSRD